MKRFKQAVPIALILLVFWFLLTAKATVVNLILGLAVSGALAALASFIVPAHIERSVSLGFALRMPVFFILLLWEIIKANWDVFKQVVAPSFPIDPRVMKYDSFLESDEALTVLAGAINLTPGTVTLEIEENTFFVHCLAGLQEEGMAGGKLERMVAWLFDEGPEDMRRLS